MVKDIKQVKRFILISEPIKYEIKYKQALVKGSAKAEDLESLRSIGIMGVLIGETFMRETDIEQSFKKLFNSI